MINFIQKMWCFAKTDDLVKDFLSEPKTRVQGFLWGSIIHRETNGQPCADRALFSQAEAVARDKMGFLNSDGTLDVMSEIPPSHVDLELQIQLHEARIMARRDANFFNGYRDAIGIMENENA